MDISLQADLYMQALASTPGKTPDQINIDQEELELMIDLQRTRQIMDQYVENDTAD